MNLEAFDDPAFLSHVAVALRTHRDALRDSAHQVPPAVAELEAWCARRVRTVQGGSNLIATVRDVQDAAMSPPLLHPLAEAAKLLAVSDATVKRLAAAGELPTVKIGTRTLVHREDLDHYLARLRKAC